MIFNIFSPEKLKPIFLSFIIIFPAVASCGSGYNPTYYSPDMHTSLCDTYVKKNARFFQAELNKISVHYEAGEWDKLQHVLNGEDFNKYITQLSECSVTYRYTNKINYFRLSYTYTLLLLDRVNEPKKKSVSSVERLNELVIDISDDIDKILLSSKTKTQRDID